MQTARRLYVYLLSGISLGALVIGVTMLLTVLFEALGLGPTGEVVFGGEDATRQQLTLASAVTAVSLPVWLIHWFAAERSVRPDRPNASIERTSDVRGLYFALAMGALLLAMATGVASMLEAIVLTLAGAETFARSVGGSLALAVVAGAAWGYHVLLRTRDWSRGPMTDAGAWLPRTYLYVAMFAGLFLLLSGVTGFIELLGRIILDEPPAFIDSSSGPWWAFPLASAVTGVAVGGAIWLGHVWYANRLLLDPGWRGASERPARLRLAFFVAVLMAATAGTIYLIGDGLGNALAAALGVSDTEEAGQTVGLIILPILSAVPYGIAWWIHARWLEGESEASGSPERIETGHRLQLYPCRWWALPCGDCDGLAHRHPHRRGARWGAARRRRRLATGALAVRAVRGARHRCVDLALARSDLALGGRPHRRGLVDDTLGNAAHHPGREHRRRSHQHRLHPLSDLRHPLRADVDRRRDLRAEPADRRGAGGGRRGDLPRRPAPS